VRIDRFKLLALIIGLLNAPWAFGDTASEALSKLETHGFGASALRSSSDGVSSNGAESSILDCLSRDSRERAMNYLNFSAKGVWSSPAAENAYAAYNNAAMDADKRCALYFFIQGVHQLGKLQFKESAQMFTTCYCARHFNEFSKTLLRLRLQFLSNSCWSAKRIRLPAQAETPGQEDSCVQTLTRWIAKP